MGRGHSKGPLSKKATPKVASFLYILKDLLLYQLYFPLYFKLVFQHNSAGLQSCIKVDAPFITVDLTVKAKPALVFPYGSFTITLYPETSFTGLVVSLMVPLIINSSRSPARTVRFL